MLAQKIYGNNNEAETTTAVEEIIVENLNSISTCNSK